MVSDNARSGMQQAPARSLFNALGFTAEEMKKPMIGIVSSYNEIVPGHMNIDKIVNAVKLGVAEAGGVPVVFPAIAVCDGIAMGHVGMKYSLVTRDLIADSTECMAIAHQFDGLVMVPNCDKNVPGLLMAAARINRLDREQLVRREAALDPQEAARRFRPTFSIPTRKNFTFQAAHLSPR